MARDRFDDRDDRDDRPRRDDRDDDRPRRARGDDDRPRRRDRDDDTPPKKDVSVLGIFGLIASVVSLLMSFIPFLGMFACIPGLIALVKSGIALLVAKLSQGRVGTGIPLTGTILSGVAILISIAQIVIIVLIAKNMPPPPTTSLSTPADVTVTAEQLDAAYDENVVAADAKYKGKTLDVTGVVERVADLKKFHLTVVLEGDFSTVNCDFSTSDKASLATLKPGSSVTIRGKCIGRRTVDDEKYVTLENCTVIPPGTPKPPDATKPGTKVTAEQLRKETDDDLDAATKKYGDKAVEVSGQVTGIDRTAPDVVVVGLGVGKRGDVQCVFAAKDAGGLAGLKDGQQVSIRGTCLIDDGLVSIVTVKDCTLVK